MTKLVASKRQVGGSHYLTGVDGPGLWCEKHNLGALQSAAIKHILRAGRKGPPAEDIRKAIHELELWLECHQEDDLVSQLHPYTSLEKDQTK